MQNYLFGLAILLIGFILLLLYSRFIKGTKLAYKKQLSLLNPAEKQLFELLISLVGRDKYVCPKVRITDIINPGNDKQHSDYWQKWNQIAQKHVDFLICDSNTFEPLIAVELDGITHTYASRIARDKLVDTAFGEAGMKIVHIPSSKLHDRSFISSQINLAA